jgi:hypothetical protein
MKVRAQRAGREEGRAQEASRGLREAGRGVQAPDNGLAIDIDRSPLVVAQRSWLGCLFGNRARGNDRRTEVTSTPPLPITQQPLSSEEVEKMFARADEVLLIVNGVSGKPKPEVVAKIVSMTGVWVGDGKNADHRIWRRRTCECKIRETLESADPQEGILDKEEFWEERLNTMFQTSEGLFSLDTEAVRRNYETLAGQQGSVVRERIRVEVAMGQGVRGDLRVFNFFSQEFSTCSPVAMYNHDSHVGGLFHYGAGDHVNQRAALEKMRDDICPTVCFMADNKMWDNTNDIKAVGEILGNGLQIVVGGSNQYSFFLSDEAKPELCGGIALGTTRMNLTRGDNLPKDLGTEIGLRMYHAAKTFDPGFESFPDK